MHWVLIIYEEIPDNTKIYYMQVNDEEFEKIKLCHNHFIGEQCQPMHNAALDWLYLFLSDRSRDKCLWNSETDTCIPIIKGEMHIIVTGQFL